MNTEGNNNKHGLSRVDRFYHSVGTIVENMATVSTVAIYTMAIFKLAQLVARIIQS